MAQYRLPNLPLWEERWNRQALLKKKAAGERAFTRGFHLQAYTDEERMFRSYRTCYEPGLRLDEVLQRRLPAYVGVDLAGKKRPGNAIFVLGLGEHFQRYPLEILRGAWSSPETAARLVEINARHDVRIVMVENNAYQGALVDWIQQDTRARASGLWMKVEEYTTTSATKTHHEIGLPALEVEFKNKAWSIASSAFMGHEMTCQCGFCTWRREMDDYPMSPQSDTVMACVVGGTEITTERGFVPIENVVEGDKVLTHVGRFRRVTGLSRRQYRGDMILMRVSTKTRMLCCTPDHKIFVQMNDGWVWAAASQIRVDDRLLRPRENKHAHVTTKGSVVLDCAVYNLHVEEDESFTAEGVAVHNCFFAREAAIRWGGMTRTPQEIGDILSR